MVKLLHYKSLTILVMICLARTASAGAWLQKSGESTLIPKYENKTLFSYYTDPTTNRKYWSKASILEMYSLFYQYGINDRLTLILEEKWFNYKGYYKFYNEDSEAYNFFAETEMMYDNHYQKFENNPYESKILLQTSLWSNDNSVFSIQPGFEFYNRNLDKAVELNLLYGYNFKYGYLNLESGIGKNIRHLSNEEQEWTSKFETSLGLEVTSRYTLLLQLFNKRNIVIYRDQHSNVGQASWLYKYDQNFSWQVGYSTNLTERDNYVTESVITSMIIKF